MAKTSAARRATKKNPALWIVGNPPKGVLSESQAWSRIRAIASKLEERSARNDLVAIANMMLAQLRKGVHANPGASTGSRVKMSNDVQAIVYDHVTEGPRCHGYGNADIDLRTRGDTLSITGLHERTGVEMFGLADGSVLIKRKDGKPVWKNLPA
jgi:hypothetical protein